jgi:hypothetical protein
MILAGNLRMSLRGVNLTTDGTDHTDGLHTIVFRRHILR